MIICVYNPDIQLAPGFWCSEGGHVTAVVVAVNAKRDEKTALLFVSFSVGGKLRLVCLDIPYQYYPCSADTEYG